MKDLIDALLTLLSYVFMGMIMLAVLGVLFIVSVGITGGPMLGSKIFYIVSVYSIVVLFVFCIYLAVQSR